MNRKSDFLIIGAGLAGSLLAWSLIRRGQRVVIISDPLTPAASRAAAGLINPVTGQRLVLQENIESLLTAAETLYRNIESLFDIELLHQLDMLRLFRNDKERAAWEKRQADPAYKSFIENDLVSPDGFIQHHTGWLDTNLLLDTLHGELKSSGLLVESTFRHEDLIIARDSIKWHDINANTIIFCEGWRGRNNPWFGHLPFQPAKGEILTLCGEAPDQIINRGKWLLPVSEKLFKLGATYDWQELDDETTEKAKRELLEALPSLHAGTDTVKVMKHVAGVRPGTMDKHPFIGLHAETPSLAIFNGFGSKGSLLIPWYAEKFTAHFLNHEPLPKEADIARFHGQIFNHR